MPPFFNNQIIEFFMNYFIPFFPFLISLPFKWKTFSISFFDSVSPGFQLHFAARENFSQMIEVELVSFSFLPSIFLSSIQVFIELVMFNELYSRRWYLICMRRNRLSREQEIWSIWDGTEWEEGRGATCFLRMESKKKAEAVDVLEEKSYNLVIENDIFHEDSWNYHSRIFRKIYSKVIFYFRFSSADFCLMLRKREMMVNENWKAPWVLVYNFWRTEVAWKLDTS